MNKSMADRKNKSKKIWIALGIISAIVLIVLTTIFCIFLRKPNYSYAQINDAFWIRAHDGNNDQYEIHADQIISKEEAMTALMDYYMNNGRSIKIQWNQLY